MVNDDQQKNKECLFDACAAEVDELTFIKLLSTLKLGELYDVLRTLETGKHCICTKIHPRRYWLQQVKNYKLAEAARKIKSLKT